MTGATSTLPTFSPPRDNNGAAGNVDDTPQAPPSDLCGPPQDSVAPASASRCTTEAHARRGNNQCLSRTPRVRIGSPVSFRTTVGHPDGNDRGRFLKIATARRRAQVASSASQDRPFAGFRRRRPPADEPKRKPEALLCPRGGPGPVSGDRCQSLATGPFACRRIPASKQCEVLAHSPWCKAPASEP